MDHSILHEVQVPSSFPTWLFGRIVLPSCNDFRDCEELYERSDRFVCVMMIDVCKKISCEIHLEGFYGLLLHTSAGRCIFVCIIVWDCRRN